MLFNKKVGAILGYSIGFIVLSQAYKFITLELIIINN